MGILDKLLSRRNQKQPNAAGNPSQEIDSLVDELVRIGRKDGFISEKPGGKFDELMHHKRARQIGIILNEKGGVALMRQVAYSVQARIGNVRHLEYCWDGIGQWMG